MSALDPVTALTIDSVFSNTYLLDIIFSYLDPRSIKNATLVSM